MKLSRRNILKLMGLSAMSPSMIQKVLASGQLETHFLVVMTISGGWDTTLGPDPWLESQNPDKTDLFIEYNQNQVLRKGGISLGPACAPIMKFAGDMSVVNGIFLSETDNGHVAAENYMLTGNATHTSSMVLSFADQFNETEGIGVLSNESIIRAAATSSASTIRGVQDAYNDKISGNQLIELVNQTSHNSPLVRAMKEAVASAPQVNELYQNLDNSDYAQADETKKDALIVANAFRAHCSQYAELSMSSQGNLDTHSNHEGNHLNSLTSAFSDIAKFIDVFKATPYGSSGGSLYDKTTFMITSEFARTAALNSAKGKDHNPMTNSAIFIGNRVAKGKMIGASASIKRKQSMIGLPYQMGMPYDYDAGQVVRDRNQAKDFITPTNIKRSLCELMGIDASKVEGLTAETKFLSELIS